MWLTLTTALGFAPVVAAGSAVSAQSLQVSDQVTLAGSLRSGAVEELAARNALVVDLRGTSEGADVEARDLALAGVTYVHLPQSAAPPPAQDVAFLRDLLAVNGDRPVIIHCSSGNRAGLLWGAYRLEQGRALPDVLAEVAPIATRAAIQEAIAQYATARGQGDHGASSDGPAPLGEDAHP